MKRRLDDIVAERFGLSKTKAAAVIAAGRVTVDGQPGRKPGQSVDEGARVDYASGPEPVSRAGRKLGDALDRWSLRFDGRTVLDVGASTGGFTEAVLERGARMVYAVDVGRGQLAWSLRTDRRVVSLERTDIRKLKRLPVHPDAAVIDVSFISLRSILPAVGRLIPSGAPVVALFKPQFEVGRATASRHRGVIRDETAVAEALEAFLTWARENGWGPRDRVLSTVPGSKGNREYLVRLTSPR